MVGWIESLRREIVAVMRERGESEEHYEVLVGTGAANCKLFPLAAGRTKTRTNFLSFFLSLSTAGGAKRWVVGLSMN